MPGEGNRQYHNVINKKAKSIILVSKGSKSGKGRKTYLKESKRLRRESEDTPNFLLLIVSSSK